MADFWDPFDEGYEGPDYASNPWDIVVLNGTIVPGVSTVRVTQKKRLDKRKKHGADGGPTIDGGYEAAAVEITVTLSKRSQWELWQALKAKLWRAPGKESRLDRPGPKSSGAQPESAVRITHPACKDAEVAAIVIESMESPQPGPVVGTMVIRIHAIQYIPPRAKSVTRKATGAGDVVPNVRIQEWRNGTGKPPSRCEAKPVVNFTPGPGA